VPSPIPRRAGSTGADHRCAETLLYIQTVFIIFVSLVYVAGPYKLVWKRGIAVLTAGSVKVTPDDRVSLVDRFNLQIQNVKTTDGGDYICQLGTMTPKEITHTVEVLGE